MADGHGSMAIVCVCVCVWGGGGGGHKPLSTALWGPWFVHLCTVVCLPV